MKNELIVWQNGNEKYEVSVDYISMPSVSYNFNDFVGLKLIDIDSVGIDVADIKFDKSISKADKYDYLMAIFSGVVSAAVDILVVGKTDLSKFKTLNNKQKVELAKKLLLLSGITTKGIDYIVDEFEEKLRIDNEVIDRVNNVKKMAEDFCNSLSVKSLLFNLFETITSYSICKDKNGKIIFVKSENSELTKGMNIYQLVEFGFVGWLFKQARIFAEKGKYNEEISDVVKFKGAVDNIKEVIRDLASTKFIKDKNYDENKAYKWLTTKIYDHTKDLSKDIDEINLKKILAKQAIPVLMNKCIIRGHVFVRALVKELKERKVFNQEGLSLIDVSINNSKYDRVIKRMDTVATGVFAAIDGIDALAYASKEAAKVAAVTPGEAGIKTTAALSAGIYAYVSSINVANAFEMIAVIKADQQYIVEDINEYLSKEAVSRQIALEKARKKEQELVVEYVGLNKVETRILYSLELQMIERDIKNTKDSKTQILKNKWKEIWVEKSKEAVDLNHLFDEDQEKTYKMLITHASTPSDNSWLYKIAIELELFEPYHRLGLENDKEFAKLKLVDNDYVKNVFCKKQEFISLKEANELNKTYLRNYEYIGGETTKKAVGIAGTVAFVALSGGLAFIFAPAIAVALAGGAFAGLSGAALTGASLAFFGGGSLAVGGLGMAGGTVVIAGGGALLGLGASGATAASLAFLSSPKFIQRDYAKLLATCDYILLKKFLKTNEVCAIQKDVERKLNDFKVELALIENAKEVEDKKSQKILIKDLRNSITIVEKANNRLVKIIKNNVVN